MTPLPGALAVLCAAIAAVMIRRRTSKEATVLPRNTDPLKPNSWALRMLTYVEDWDNMEDKARADLSPGSFLWCAKYADQLNEIRNLPELTTN